MKAFNKFMAVAACVALMITQLPFIASANTAPDYLQFPYFDDFESCNDFLVIAKTGSISEDVAPESLQGTLPKAYDGTTITKVSNSSWRGTIETYSDGVERMIKSSRNYGSKLNFDVGEFEPGLLSKQFTMECRFKLDETAVSDNSAVPRVFGEIARGKLGTNGNEFEDTIKLFFLVNGSVRIANNSRAESSSLLQDPDTNETFVMSPNKWYTIKCTYDFSEDSNNLTVTLMGERSDGSKIEASRTTSLVLLNDIPAEELTRFRLSHYDSDGDHNGKSVVYYKDLSLYNDEGSVGASRSMSLPFSDDFESYEPFEAQAQLLKTNGVDYPPVMNYGRLPSNYKNSTLTPDLTDKNRGFIDLAEEADGNNYIRIKVDKAWGRNNIDIGPFESGVLNSDNICAKFRAKMGEPGDTDHPGVMILLSQTGAGNNNETINSVPLLYFYPDRVLAFNGPMENLKRAWESFNTVWIKNSSGGNLRLTTGTWYDFECIFDFAEQKMSVKIKNEDNNEVYTAQTDSMAWCPQDFNPDSLTTFRLRSDARGSRDYLLTAGFDDISITSIPKFKFSADVQGKENISPTQLESIQVSFPQIKADPATISDSCVSMEPAVDDLRVTNITGEGFTIDLSNSGVLLEKTKYKLSLNGISGENGEELSGDGITFTTGETEKYIIYNDTFAFTSQGEETDKLVSGDIEFTMDAGNYSDEDITFAMGLYKKGENNYDTLVKYAESTVFSGVKTTLTESFNVPSADGYYIKGYFLSEPLNSIAQDFIIDSSGIHFTERSDTVYEYISYGPENVIVYENEDSVENICDGDTGTYWETYGSGDGSYITVDMGTEETIDFVQLAFSAADDGTMNYNYTVSVSEDGYDFNEVASGTTVNRENLKFIQNRFNPVKARYVRISKSDSTDGEMRLSHIGFYRLKDNQYWAF